MEEQEEPPVSVPTAAVEAFWRRTETPGREVFRDPERAHRRVDAMLRAFYGILLLLVVGELPSKLDLALDTPHDAPLWPVVWMSWLPWNTAVCIVLAACVSGATMAFLFPRVPAVRFWAFLGFFEFVALWYTYSGVKHSPYLLLYLTGFFALLPRTGKPGEAGPHLRPYLMLVWGGIAFVLSTYSMAGCLKLWGVAEAFLHGDRNIFNFGLGPATIVATFYKWVNPPPLAGFLLDYPAIAVLGFFCAIYIEFVSLAVAFRPHLMRWWFLVLIGFHCGTAIAMRVFFEPAVAVLIVLFVFSPFSRPMRHWRQTLRELPIFGPLLGMVLHSGAGSPETTRSRGVI